MAVECPKCHQLNDDADERCAFCSSPLVIPIMPSEGLGALSQSVGLLSPKRCPFHPDANVRLEKDHLLCSECGHDLGKLQSGDAAVAEDAENERFGANEEGTRSAYLEVEGGQEVFFRGAYTTRVPLKANSLLFGRRDVMASHYPDIDLMMYRKLDPAISRRHLRLFRENGRFFVEDLCNNNATFINDYSNKLNHERRELRHGDRIFVSMSLSFIFRFED